MNINFNADDGEESLFVIKPRRNKSVSSFTLRLTSMIDMFTILLVFLLQSFSAEGEIMSVSSDLRLPESTAKKPPKASPILIVTQEWLILDGRPIEKIEVVNSLTGNLIPTLGAQLSDIKAFSSSLGALDATRGFKGEITIQGDREVPFSLLKKIMFTCGQEGYNNMLLAVNQVEGI